MNVEEHAVTDLLEEVERGWVIAIQHLLKICNRNRTLHSIDDSQVENSDSDRNSHSNCNSDGDSNCDVSADAK